MTTKDNPDDLFPSLQQEPLNILAELYNNPDKLYEYFAEQQSTKELYQENASLQRSNIEQAEQNIKLKEKIAAIKSHIHESLKELDEAKDELKTMQMLVEEAEQRNSFDAVMHNLSADLASCESELRQYLADCESQSSLSYADFSKKILPMYQRIHETRFSMEWISANHEKEWNKK